MSYRLATRLHDVIGSVADGVSVGRLDDKSTWRVAYSSNASAAQIAAANAVIEAFNVDADRLAYERTATKLRIDTDAEVQRQKHLSPGAGMALTYSEKFAQAQAVNAMGEAAANALSQAQREAQFPTLSASVGIEHATLWGAAQIVLQRYAAFAQLSMAIERARLAGKKAVGEAQTVEAVQAAYEAVTWPT